MQRVLVYGLAAGLGLAACQNGSFFVCADDSSCVDGSAVGQCEQNGACSFPDDGCPSGRSYGSNGDPALAGSCVEVDGGTTGDIETTTTDTPPVGTTSTTTDVGETTDGPGDDTAGAACPPDWWDCAWLRRQRLSIDVPSGVSETDVPVLVLLTDGRVQQDQIQADAEDLRFVQADGTLAPYEIEHVDPEGVSRIWVRVDEVSASADHLWLYYGNVAAAGVTDSTAVWGDPYVGVWHLEADPAVDATAYGHDAVSSGNVAVAPGQIGNGIDILSSTSRLDVVATEALADIFANGATVSAWIRPRTHGGSGFGRIVQKGSDTLGWRLYIGETGRLRFSLEATDEIWTTADDAFALHQWVHVAVTADFGANLGPTLYVDGVEVELESAGTIAPDLPTDLDAPLAIGNRTAGGRQFAGIIDELHLQTQLRGPQWLALQNASMRDALLTFGDVEAIGEMP